MNKEWTRFLPAPCCRVFLLTLALLMLTGGKVAFCQIEPYAKNPWYWQYDGKPILLVGGSDRDNIFQWAGQGTRLTDHLDLMARCGGNYVRCPMTSREYTADGHRWDLLPYPFAKVNGKYDLTKWDDAYWKEREPGTDAEAGARLWRTVFAGGASCSAPSCIRLRTWARSWNTS